MRNKKDVKHKKLEKMKRKRMNKFTVLTLAVLMMAGTQAFAQRGRNVNNNTNRSYRNAATCWRIPNLTTDQEAKIESLRVEQWKEMNNYRNQMNELRARKRTLNTTPQDDMSELNGVIDQMTDVHNKMMKASAKHRQDVRKQLTDEQKVYFDSMPARGQRYNRGANRRGGSCGNYRNSGKGYGDGYGYRNSNYPINEE